MAGNAEYLPPAFHVVNEAGTSPYVLVCEHASQFIPARYKGLGLAPADLGRHIAWDIGAAEVALRLSRDIDAALIAANYSRLLIDLNRPVHSSTSIPESSESTFIPGNCNMSKAERRHRIESYFVPFQDRLAKLLDARRADNRLTMIIGIHSFTPVFKGLARPWHAGVLFRRSVLLGRSLVTALGGPSMLIAENQPYQIEDDSDYTVPVHGEGRGLDAVLVEIRQDLIASGDGAGNWAKRLAAALNSRTVQSASR